MPKLIIKKMSLEDNINFVKDLFGEGDEFLDTYTLTINLFPELKEISLDSPREVIDEKIKEVVTRYYNSYDKFDDDIKRYSTVWNKYNDLFFERLTGYLNTDWPLEHDAVSVSVGIIPVCPRYLDKFSFSVHEGISDDHFIETCAHELCHFLWFKKWKELYPACPREEYEAPSLVWEYSEMAVEPILNSSDISEVFDGKKARYCYDYFYDTNPSLMEKLNDIFNKNISIEDKIINGYEYLKTIKK